VVLKDQGLEQLVGFAKEVIRRCGEESLNYYGKGSSHMKFDETLVTEAELHLREFFQDQLYTHFPEHQVFSNNQERQGYTHEGKRYLWIFDALDGVANFQAGIPVWGISVALLENFWPLLGMFYMPVTNDLFHACAGAKAFRGDEEIRISGQEIIDDESLLLTYSRFHRRYQSLFPGKMRDFGCTGAHLCYVAMGRAEAAIIANETYQNLGAFSIIIEAAGGNIYSMDGGPFSLNEYMDGRRIDDPLIVTTANIYSQVRDSLREIS